MTKNMLAAVLLLLGVTAKAAPLVTKADLAPSGATSGQVYTFDGTAWAPAAAAVSSPGGANTNIQYNDSGAFAGDTYNNWNKSAKTLGVRNTAAGTGIALDVGGGPFGDNIIRVQATSGFQAMTYYHHDDGNPFNIRTGLSGTDGEDYLIQNGGGDEMRFSALSGNVGIGPGPLAPGFKLDVTGSANFSSSATAGGTGFFGLGTGITKVVHYAHAGGFSSTLAEGTTFAAFVPDEAVTLKRITVTVVVPGIGGAGDTYRCQDASGNNVAVTVSAAAVAGTVTTATGTGAISSGVQVNGLLYTSAAATSPVVNLICEYTTP